MITDRLAAALADRYRIERELGEGGMATVYLAHDVKHERKVALKILKPELAAVIGAERFLREIKTIAGLQHPHILGLIDSGEIEGTAYFVMPFVEGESLRDRLNREKQLPIADSVRIAVEVSEALDYAHRHGVIHRDIKPENILLHDGQALVADFGIALAASNAGGARMTQTGMSLGTPHYMSPEQAMGEREITSRSDVYALGCTLYEMLVGEPPFTGPTAQAIVAKVMTEKPVAPTRLRETVPAFVESAVLTALQKLPADRFSSAAAFGDALRSAPLNTQVAATSSSATSARPASTRLIVVALACIAAGATASAAILRSGPATQLSTSAERQQATYSGRATQPAISADGRFFAYIETHCPELPARGGCVSLQVLEVGSSRPVEIISGANRLAIPRWTHDGLSLVVAGALDGNREGLFVIPRLGGTPRRIADEPLAYDTHATADSVAMLVMVDTVSSLRVMTLASGEFVGAPIPIHVRPIDIAWSPDGALIAFTLEDKAHVLRRSTGTITSSLAAQARDYVRWASNGRALLTFRWTAGQDDDLISLPVASDGTLGNPRLLMSLLPTRLVGQFDVARSTGRVVFGSGSQFHDVWSFDLSAPLAKSRRLTQGTNWYGPPVITADGRATYYLRADALGNSLYRIVDAKETALTAERMAVYNSLRFTADEHEITFEANTDSTSDLMVHEVTTGTTHRVARVGAREKGWLLPGGAEILWIDAEAQAYSVSDTHGANRRRLPIATTAEHSTQSIWFPTRQDGLWFLSPDGSTVAVVGEGKGGLALITVPLHGGLPRVIHRFLPPDVTIGLAGWSADGLIHVDARSAEQSTTRLVSVDPTTGKVKSEVVLPAACNPGSVSYAPAAHRAVCLVIESRADVMLLDGIRP